MKHPITLGIVCMGRDSFDTGIAAELYAETKRGIQAVENVRWIVAEELIRETEEAEATAARFLSEGVDGVVLLSGTFHLGHLALVFQRRIDAPKLLWGFNELPYNGGKIRLNTVCAINLNASNLYKAGCDSYVCHVGDSIDEAWIDAVRIRAALRGARFGVLGSRAHGFFNLTPDELALFGEAGVMADYFDLREGYEQPVSEEELAESGARIKELFACGELNETQMKKTARLVCSLRRFMETNRLDAAALRCWPEFANQYGIAPCAAMSVLQAEGRILACEGDLQGAMSMLALRAAGAESPYLADLSQIDFENNFALMWHCGVAPANLWDGVSERSLDSYFAGGRGVTAGFVMKSGPVHILRIDTARGKTRLFSQAGEAYPMKKLLKGTYAKVVFEKDTRALIELVTSSGVAHHAALAYGAYAQVIQRFARVMQWELIA
ncbi:MAG: fucose isomerase [Oscillospiraceae bacterium]|nr:fucose isomerase [Oscillospiraceae bacterium]